MDTCHQDALGIPRCLAAEVNCTNPQMYAGMACASSADCCGLPCLPVPGAEFTYVCGSSCQTTGQSCTTSTDCCAGIPCTVPAGSSQGTCGTPQGCSSYGQACDASNPCCDNITCSNGICGTVIL